MFFLGGRNKMGPDTANCMLLGEHVDENDIIIIISSHAIKWQTSVSARYVSKKTLHCCKVVLQVICIFIKFIRPFKLLIFLCH